MRVMVVLCPSGRDELQRRDLRRRHRDAAKARPRRRCLRSLRRELSGHHEPRRPAALFTRSRRTVLWPRRGSSGWRRRTRSCWSFPTWVFLRHPAILKGFCEKVFLPGVAFDLVDRQGARARCGISSEWAACRPMAARAGARLPGRRSAAQALHAHAARLCGNRRTDLVHGLLRHETATTRRALKNLFSSCVRRGVFGLVDAGGRATPVARHGLLDREPPARS